MVKVLCQKKKSEFVSNLADSSSYSVMLDTNLPVVPKKNAPWSHSGKKYLFSSLWKLYSFYIFYLELTNRINFLKVESTKAIERPAKYQQTEWFPTHVWQ